MTNLELAAKLRSILAESDAQFKEANSGKLAEFERHAKMASAFGRLQGHVDSCAYEAEYLTRIENADSKVTS